MQMTQARFNILILFLPLGQASADASEILWGQRIPSRNAHKTFGNARDVDGPSLPLKKPITM